MSRRFEFENGRIIDTYAQRRTLKIPEWAENTFELPAYLAVGLLCCAGVVVMLGVLVFAVLAVVHAL